jgi:hypothetical protein
MQLMRGKRKEKENILVLISIKHFYDNKHNEGMVRVRSKIGECNASLVPDF